MAPTWSVNRRAAETVCRHAADVDDARMLLELLGLVDEGGDELLPDDKQVITSELLAIPLSGSTASRVVDEPPARRNTTPAGLANLPSPPPPKKGTAMTAAQTKPRPRAEVLEDQLVASGVIRRDEAASAAVTLESPDGERGVLIGSADKIAALVRPEAVVAPSPAAGPYVAALSVVELFVDRGYQRPLDEPRVRRMVKAWDPRMLGILEVSDRGPGVVPRYALVDGQQRWTAAGLVGVQYVACNVHEGLAVADEARLMFELDRAKKKLSGWDQWRARRGAGDPVVATVERVAAGHGLRVDDTGELRSYGTAEKLLKVGGEQLLDSALAVLRAAYGETVSAYQAPLLMGVGQLLHRHPDLDAPRLTRVLAGIRPEQLRSTATALREVDGGPLHELMTRTIAGQYNRTPGPRISGRAA